MSPLPRLARAQTQACASLPCPALDAEHPSSDVIKTNHAYAAAVGSEILSLSHYLQMECVKRNIGHLCTKDERQPRAKKPKTDHKDKSQTKT